MNLKFYLFFSTIRTSKAIHSDCEHVVTPELICVNYYLYAHCKTIALYLKHPWKILNLDAPKWLGNYFWFTRQFTNAAIAWICCAIFSSLLLVADLLNWLLRIFVTAHIWCITCRTRQWIYWHRFRYTHPDISPDPVFPCFHWIKTISVSTAEIFSVKVKSLSL